jgi:FK506-binding protein 4/5
MKKGEKALLKVSGDYAKGQPSAPADATLHYEVELLDFTKDKPSWEMSNAEKLAAAQKAKDEGNELFKAGKFKGAIKKYSVRHNYCVDYACVQLGRD